MPSPAQTLLTSLEARHDSYEPARHAILEYMLMNAPFDGWTVASLSNAVREAGFDDIEGNTEANGIGILAFPDGLIDIIDFFAEQSDIAMITAMTEPPFADMKIREKVAHAVTARLDFLAPHKEPARRAAATLALPIYATTGAKLVWRTADYIWRGLGDSSTDLNYYTKRATLGAVWSSTFAKWLSDTSDDHEDTRLFLDDRIETVMGIERLKKQWRDTKIDPGKFVAETMIPALAKLRYPAKQ